MGSYLYIAHGKMEWTDQEASNMEGTYMPSSSLTNLQVLMGFQKQKRYKDDTHQDVRLGMNAGYGGTLCSRQPRGQVVLHFLTVLSTCSLIFIDTVGTNSLHLGSISGQLKRSHREINTGSFGLDVFLMPRIQKNGKSSEIQRFLFG